MMGINPDSTYERFEFDQAVSGLGAYVDGKLAEFDKKTFEPIYSSVQAVLDLAKPKTLPTKSVTKTDSLGKMPKTPLAKIRRVQKKK